MGSKKYRSKFEGRVSDKLDVLGISHTYETESVEYFLKVPKGYCENCDSPQVYQAHWYTPDFFLGNGVVLEVKGYFKAKDRTKHIAVREAHPEMDLRFVFYSNNKIHKHSETRYADWCEQHGFKYYIGIPDEFN